MDGLEDQDGLSEAGEPPRGLKNGAGSRVLVLPVNGDQKDNADSFQ